MSRQPGRLPSRLRQSGSEQLQTGNALRRRAIFACVSLLGWSSQAPAEPIDPTASRFWGATTAAGMLLEIHWQPGPACATLDAFLPLLHKHVERLSPAHVQERSDGGSPMAGLAFTVQFSASADQVLVQFRSASGSRERRLTGESCEALLESAAFVIAMILDEHTTVSRAGPPGHAASALVPHPNPQSPDTASQAPAPAAPAADDEPRGRVPERPTPGDSPATRGSPVSPATATAPPSPGNVPLPARATGGRPMSHGIGGLASVERGYSDSVAWGVGILGFVGWDLDGPWLVEVSLRLSRSSDTLKTPGLDALVGSDTASTSLVKLAGALSACPLGLQVTDRATLRVCSEFELGRVDAATTLTTSVRQATIWGSNGFGVRLTLPFWKLRLDAWSTVQRHWVRPRYFVTLDDTRHWLYRVPAWGTTAGLAISMGR